MSNNNEKMFNEEDAVRLCEISTIVNDKINNSGNYYDGDMNDAFNELYVPVLNEWKESDEPYVSEFANRKAESIVADNKDSIRKINDNIDTRYEEGEIPATGKEFKEILLAKVDREMNSSFIKIGNNDLLRAENLMHSSGIEHQTYSDANTLYAENYALNNINNNKQVLDKIVPDESKPLISPVTFVNKSVEYDNEYLQSSMKQLDATSTECLTTIMNGQSVQSPTINNAYIKHQELIDNLDAVDNDEFVSGLMEGMK